MSCRPFFGKLVAGKISNKEKQAVLHSYEKFSDKIFSGQGKDRRRLRIRLISFAKIKGSKHFTFMQKCDTIYILG